MDIELIVHVMISIFVVFVISVATIFLLIDLFSRVDYLKEKAPRLKRVLERRDAFAALLVVAVFLQIGDSYELVTKEIPEAPPLVMNIKAPLPMAIEWSLNEDSIKEERFKTIRDGLAALIQEGIRVRDKAPENGGTVPPDVLSDWKAWTVQVDLFLKKHLDAADAITFKSYEAGEFAPLNFKIRSEIGDLEHLLDHLGP